MGHGLKNQSCGSQSFQTSPDRLVDADVDLALRDKVEDPILGEMALLELLNQMFEFVPG